MGVCSVIHSGHKGEVGEDDSWYRRICPGPRSSSRCGMKNARSRGFQLVLVLYQQADCSVAGSIHGCVAPG